METMIWLITNPQFTFRHRIISLLVCLRSLVFIRGLEILNETGRREHASIS